jgi:membrane associated rhomboid family serine protease
MLDDRDYMRQPVYRTPQISFTIVLLIVNAIIFLFQLLAENSPHGAEIEGRYFALSLDGLKHGYVWQLLTFQFMHAGWMHILFNSFAIFFFGRPVEMVLGARRFLALYFLSGIIGGGVQMLFALSFSAFDSSVVGASAGAYGLVAAFAVLNWTERFTLFIYFIPVTMRGRTLLWVSIVLAIFGSLTPNNGIADGAHLGGILAGFFLARQFFRGYSSAWGFSASREPVAARKKKFFWQSKINDDASPEISTDEFLQSQVDPILEKISAKGIGSLTAREREILESARKKMNHP